MLKFLKEGGNRAKFGLGGIILGLALIFVVGNMLSISATDAPEDVTPHVKVKLDELYISNYDPATKTHKRIDVIKDGTNVPGAPDLTVGDSLFINYRWELPSLNPKKIKKDNYFIINVLPTGIFEGRSTYGKQVYLTRRNENTGQDEEVEIGTFDFIFDPDNNLNYIKVTFTRDDFDEVKNATLGITLSAAKPIDELIIDNKEDGNNVKIKIKPAPDFEKGHHPEHFHPFPDPQSPIYKWGDERVITGNKIGYTIPINRDMARDIFIKEPVKKSKAYIIDELPYGLELKKYGDVGKVKVTIPLYAPGYMQEGPDKGKLTDIGSWRYVLYSELQLNASGDALMYTSGKKGFDVIDYAGTAEDKPWDTFKDEILQRGLPTLGIWRNTKIIMYFGDIPGADTPLYNDIYKEPTDPNILKDGLLEIQRQLNHATHPGRKFAISREQKAMMEKAYVNKPVVTYILSFDTEIKSEVPEYINTVYYHYDDHTTKSDSRRNELAGVRSSGKAGTFTGDILVTKEWVGTKKDSVTVRLLADGQPYQNRDKTGQYSIILNEQNGWKDKFTDLLTNNYQTGNPYKYLVTEDPIPGYATDIYLIEKVGFRIVNTELARLTVAAKWFGTPSDAPMSFDVFKDGIKYKTYQLSADNAWKLEINDLPKYRMEGNTPVLIRYTVKGQDLPGYRTDVVETDPYNFTLKNFEQVEYSVRKIWQDSEGNVLTNPKFKPIKVQIHADNGRVLENLTVTRDMRWRGKFAPVDKYHENMTPIVYTFTETPVPGFNKDRNDIISVENGIVTVTNRRNEAKPPKAKFISSEDPNSPEKFNEYIIFDFKGKDASQNDSKMISRDGVNSGMVRAYFTFEDGGTVENEYLHKKEIVGSVALVDSQDVKIDTLAEGNSVRDANGSDLRKDEKGLLIFTDRKGYYVDIPETKLGENENFIELVLSAKTKVTLYEDNTNEKIDSYFSKSVKKRFRIQRRDLFDLR